MEQLQFTDSLEDINKELQARPRRFKTYTDLAEEAEFEQKTGISSKILARVEQKEIKEFVNKALAFADSNEDMILKITKIIDMALENKTQKGLAKIKVLKAELTTQMFQMVGADTGYYKSDYAVFMTAKKDELIGSTLDQMEVQINRLKDYIKETEV